MADEQQDVNKDKESAQVGKALDSLTDRVQETEMDQGTAKAAVERLREARATDAEKQRQRQKELAAVKVDKEDIKVLAHEFELTVKVAEQHLRENEGSLEKTLRCLINDGLPAAAAS